LRRWRRVWSEFGASHQKSCKENEKGRDESLKTKGPNRKGEDREDKGARREWLETLNAGKSEAKKTSHNVCCRQLMDDANRLKCSKYQ